MSVNLFEKIWLGFAVAVLILFVAVISVGAVVDSHMTPGRSEVVNPDTVTKDDPRFSKPRLEQVSPGRYRAYLVAGMYSFLPQEIKLPAGSTVDFYVTSPDVIHGFEIAKTNVNVMVIPGYVTKASAKFQERGEYLVVCNEYCGLGHQLMATKLVVE